MAIGQRFNSALDYQERQGKEPLMFWVAPDVMDTLEAAYPGYETISPITVYGYPVFVDKALRKGTIRAKCKR